MPSAFGYLAMIRCHARGEISRIRATSRNLGHADARLDLRHLGLEPSDRGGQLRQTWHADARDDLPLRARAELRREVLRQRRCYIC